jgi:O-antigen/teichoic acid export membrane protein
MSAAAHGKEGPVLKNTLILVGAQLLGTPLTIVINAFMGRYLGASGLGDVYLAGTLMAFGFLFVEWGHSGVLPAAVAQDRSRAGLLLGSSIAWRLGASVVVSAILLLGCSLLGYTARFQIILAIVAVQWLLIVISNACQEVVRGFERTDVSALGKLGSQVLSLLLILPTLLLGGGLIVVMIVQAITQLIILALVWRATLRVGDLKLVFSWQEAKSLVQRGHSFLVFGFALTLQGNVDAIFLSKLTTPDVVGWHAAAQRLSGTLTIPATALVAALYPTLSRLLVEDMEAFKRTANRAVRGTAVLAVPLAVCCAVYRDVGISLYGEKNFGPAGDSLIILSGLLFLVYFSMPLGTTLVAAGKQRAWAVAQACCVIVSLVLNPILIPWFQKNYGNGGLGVCIGQVTSEIFMVTIALALAPKGVLDRGVAIAVAKAFVAGAVMALVAYLLRWLTPFVAAPLVVVCYFVALWAVGGIDKEQLDGVKQQIARRFGRAKAQA